MKRRVVITGLGCVSPIGNTPEETWQGILEGKCGIDEITQFDTTEYKAKFAGEVKNLDMEQYFAKRDLKFNARFVQLARIAAKQAYTDSGLEKAAINRDRFGVHIGSGVGGLKTIEDASEVIMDRGPGRVSPFFIPMSIINLASGHVAIDVEAKGNCSSSVTACAAGTSSLGEAFHRIRDGYEDIIISGGTESAIAPVGVAGFQSMRALYVGDDKNRASIPFDKERSGFVMGEGAAVLILEELTHAQSRDAKIYGEIVGYGASCDAFHITLPLEDGSGAVKAMENALSDGDIPAETIDYINAHGTSTPPNDSGETRAVKTVFGERAYDLYMSSTKAMTGHLLGASGAVEAFITIKALQENYVPPTINYKVPDPKCDLNIVPNKGINAELNYAMSNSFGFGGHNASLVFKKWEA